MSKTEISLKLSDIVNSEYLYDNQTQSINFDDLYTSFVFQQFDLIERMDIQLIWSHYSKALNECKANNLIKADYYYKKGLDALNDCNLNDKAKLYLNVYIYPNLAFREYKDNNYEKALELLLLGISNIEIIEKEYPDIYAAKIQQIHNVIRIFLKTDNKMDYIDLNINIIEHILLEINPLNNNYNLNTSILNKIKIQYKEEMLNQIFSEFLLNQIIDTSQLFDFKYFCNSLSIRIIYNNENKYLKNWLNLINLINNNSIDIVSTLENVIIKDYKFTLFKIYALNSLLKKQFLYLDSKSLQNVKTLIDFFSNKIHDKILLEKIQKTFKLNEI